MNEKKFYLAGIIVPIVCIVADMMFGSIVLGLVTGIICLIMNLKKRSTHRVAIGITLSILVFLGVVSTIAIMFHDLSMNGVIYEREGLLTEFYLQYFLGIPFNY